MNATGNVLIHDMAYGAGRQLLINDDDTLLENPVVVPTECLDEVAATVRASEPV